MKEKDYGSPSLSLSPFPIPSPEKEKMCFPWGEGYVWRELEDVGMIFCPALFVFALSSLLEVLRVVKWILMN